MAKITVLENRKKSHICKITSGASKVFHYKQKIFEFSRQKSTLDLQFWRENSITESFQYYF